MKAASPVLFALLMLAGCRPASYEQFVRADQASGGEYVFNLDLSDSTASYDISLYTRVDSGIMKAEDPSHSLGLEIRWRAASGLQADSTFLCETVYVPYGGRAGSNSLYRSGVRPNPAGEWRVLVRPLDAPAGLRGIGIICKRND